MLAPDLATAASTLASGGVVALPTETVYGLAALARDRRACREVFVLKRRPDRVPLAVLVDDAGQARPLAAHWNGRLSLLAEAFWPGPLTVVVERAEGLDLELGGDESHIGLRCPDHRVVRELARELGPLAVTSANRHGDPPCTSADQVRAAFGETLPLVDGGACDGVPSTVVDLVGGNLNVLREGGITLAELEAALAG